jgi:Flp pilus assembly protein TadD
MAAPPPAPDAPRSHVAWSAPLAIGLACALVYGGELSGPFVFDDQQAIVDNPTLGPPLSLTALSPPVETPVAGRPLTNLSFALNRAASGLAPGAFHLTNLVLHALVAWAAFLVLRRALALPSMPTSVRSRSHALALASALLFAAHPMVVEVVLYATQRSEGLAALFYLVAFYLLLVAEEHGQRRLVLPMFLVGVPGVASKESFVTAPVLLLCFDRAFLAGSFRGALQRRLALHTAAFASWLPLAWLEKGGTRPGSVRGFELDYVLAQAKIIPSYFTTALFPREPVFDYGMLVPESSRGGLAWLCVLGPLCIALCVLAWRRPRLGFPGLFVLGTLAPTSSLLSIHTEVGAERRFYLALVCVLALVVVAVQVAVASGARGAAARWGSLALLCAALSLLGARARAYAGVFDDLEHLWSYAARARPENPRAHYNLAETLRRRGRLGDAETAYRRAIAAYAGYAEAHQNLGGMLLRLGRTDEALRELRLGLDANPGDVQARFNYGIALGSAGRLEQAAAELSEVVRRAPLLLDARVKLLAALVPLHRDAEVAAQRAWLEQHAGRDPRARQALAALAALRSEAPSTPSP